MAHFLRITQLAQVLFCYKMHTILTSPINNKKSRTTTSLAHYIKFDWFNSRNDQLQLLILYANHFNSPSRRLARDRARSGQRPRPTLGGRARGCGFFMVFYGHVTTLKAHIYAPQGHMFKKVFYWCSFERVLCNFGRFGTRRYVSTDNLFF